MHGRRRKTALSSRGVKTKQLNGKSMDMSQGKSK